mgnify:CR=1 FL=1
MKKIIKIQRAVATVLAAAMMFCLAGGSSVKAAPVYSEKTYSLNSDETDNAVIDLYVYEDVPYITISDLCTLTRCEQSEDNGVVTVSQGIFSGEFNIDAQTFDDSFQTVDITIFDTGNGNYAVPALMFLSYFKATAFLSGDTLYCRMPPCTAWEALDVDYENTKVNIYDLYGGEGNVTASMAMDIIMDLIMGNLSTSDGYLSDAFVNALSVDLSKYDSVKQYVEDTQGELYEDLQSESGTEMLDALKNTLKLSAEPTEWYIQHYYNMQEQSFVELAYNAYQKGNTSEVKRYGEQFYEAFKKKNQVSSQAETYFTNANYLMLFVSSAMETAQQMKYVEATDNLAYNVMGQENMDYLGMDVADNDWFRIANQFKNVLGMSAANLQDTAMSYMTSDVLWDDSIGTIVSGASGISSGSWAFAVSAARLFTENFPLTKSLVEAFRADLSGIYLSELQQNAFAVLYQLYTKIQEDPEKSELFEKLVQAEQFYCRVSIAMYENLSVSCGEFSDDPGYWQDLFQNRIDSLAVSLYQLTEFQDDGIQDCYPIDLSSFSNQSVQGTGRQESRYQVFEMDLTWEEAKEFCENNGGHLAVITSAEEQKEVYSLIQNSQYEAYWLGGSVKDGSWQWITGEPFSYSLWDSGEPNESEEDMHLQMYRDNGTWDDTWNDGDHGTGGIMNHGFICEYEEVTGQGTFQTYEYLDQVPIISKDQYDGNEGDSFVYKLGEHRYTRGKMDIDGNTYDHGLEGWVARWNYMDEKSWAYSVFDLDGKYTKITGRGVLMDSYNTTDFDTTLEISGDGEILASCHLMPDTFPFDINLDVTGVKELKVYFYDNRAVSGGTSFGLTGMELE